MNDWVTLLINFSRFLIGRAELVNSWFDGTVIFGRVEHTSIKLFLATSNMATGLPVDERLLSMHRQRWDLSVDESLLARNFYELISSQQRQRWPRPFGRLEAFQTINGQVKLDNKTDGQELRVGERFMVRNDFCMFGCRLWKKNLNNLRGKKTYGDKKMQLFKWNWKAIHLCWKNNFLVSLCARVYAWWLDAK